jgi:hypothetical protein
MSKECILKKISHILFLLLFCSGLSSAQVQLSPLLSDPHRQASGQGSGGNYRLAATTAIVNVKDTLKLPFFDDFTSLTSPIDSFHNKITDPVTMTTHGLHGLYDGDEILIFDVRDSASSPGLLLSHLNTKHYTKRIDPFTVGLYSDQNLTIPVLGNDSIIVETRVGAWVRKNYQWSQNPDTLKWVNAGGVYINDRYAIDPPSHHVATFDGLDATGKGYSTLNTDGLSDVLTSLPIDLSSNTPADSLIMSFYWQGAGIGERPDITDSLHLQFKDQTGTWKIVWSMKGDSTAFSQVMLPVTDPLYFHNGFQFRFRSFGKVSGSYDVWNLDYILLDTGRTVTYPYHPDLTISKIPVSILKNYTAIPYRDFFSATVKPLIDSGNYVLRNLSLSKTTSPRASIDPDPRITGITDDFSKAFFQRIAPDALVYDTTEMSLYFPIDPNLITDQNKPVKLKYTISGATSDVQVEGVQYKCNDSAFAYNMLDNYYAYDDSSAEWGVGISGAGEFAVKYVIVEPSMNDTLIGVDIYFPQIQTNQAGQPFVLTIWQSIQPDNILKKQSIALSYTSLNRFKRYMLDEIIIVSDSFYIGYDQSSNFFVQMGFDKNTDSHTNVFYNVSGSWLPFTEPGSVMIRPVFGSSVSQTTSVLNPNASALACEVFPNPGTGVFHISGDIDRIVLTDLSGRTVLEKDFTNNGIKELDASSLPEGLYLLRVYNEKSSGVKKVVISR